MRGRTCVVSVFAGAVMLLAMTTDPVLSYWPLPPGPLEPVGGDWGEEVCTSPPKVCVRKPIICAVQSWGQEVQPGTPWWWTRYVKYGAAGGCSDAVVTSIGANFYWLNPDGLDWVHKAGCSGDLIWNQVGVAVSCPAAADRPGLYAVTGALCYNPPWTRCQYSQFLFVVG